MHLVLHRRQKMVDRSGKTATKQHQLRSEQIHKRRNSHAESGTVPGPDSNGFGVSCVGQGGKLQWLTITEPPKSSDAFVNYWSGTLTRTSRW